MTSIDEKISKLRKITKNFLFIEYQYYTRRSYDTYKIINEYSKNIEEKIILHKVSDGIEKSLDKALLIISEKRKEFYNDLPF